MKNQIIYRKQSELKGLFISPKEYNDEKELQEIIFNNPQLIIRGSKSEIIFVKREVKIQQSGFIDLILIDSEGLPIIVEVKLNKNKESKREIMAQIQDYASSLSQLNYSQLNDAVKGELKKDIKIISDKKKAYVLEDIERKCAQNLKNGKIKLVLAVDTANSDLIRIVEFVNDHSNLDVCLVAFNQYSINDDTIFVPSFIVDGGFNFTEGTTQFSTKLLYKNIMLQLKEVFTEKYGKWLNKLKSNTNRENLTSGQKLDIDEGWMYEFKIYQQRGDLYSDLYVRLLNSNNKISHLAFGFSQDFVTGLNEYRVSVSGWKNITTQSMVNNNKGIYDAFLKNGYQLEENEKRWLKNKQFKGAINIDNFKKFSITEMEIIKPIIERIVN